MFQLFAIGMFNAVVAELGASAPTVVGKPNPQKSANTRSTGTPKPGLFRISTTSPDNAVRTPYKSQTPLLMLCISRLSTSYSRAGFGGGGGSAGAALAGGG